MPEEFAGLPNVWQIVGGLATGAAVAVAWIFGRRFGTTAELEVLSAGEMARIRVDVEKILGAMRDAMIVRIEQGERGLREDHRELEARLRRIEEASAVILDRLKRLDR